MLFQAYGLRRPGCSALALLGALSHRARLAVLERPLGEQVDCVQARLRYKKERSTDLNASIRGTIKTAHMTPASDSKTMSEKKGILSHLVLGLLQSNNQNNAYPVRVSA